MTDHEPAERARRQGARVIPRDALHSRPAYGPPHHYGGRASTRHKRRRIIALAIAAALVAVVVVLLTRGAPAENQLALSYARAWTRGEYAAMYSRLDAHSKGAVSPAAFASAYKNDAVIATTTGLAAGTRVRDEPGGVVAVPMRVHTSLFGTLRGDLLVRVHDESSGPRIRWTGTLLFPGLRERERLARHTALPARASLLARDGSVLAEGSAPPGGESERVSPLGASASSVVGKVGPIPAAERVRLESEGVPGDATVGTSGLERAFDASLRGTPAGALLAGKRVIATSSGKASSPVRTSISPSVQRAAVLALGGQLGGVVVMRPRSGEILAVAGLGTDDLQPPGSTFKMVTLAAVLEAGVARTSSTFPYETGAVLDGVQLHNAGGESCGGTLVEAFAQSCNSVFAPLGVKLGSARLVAMAERFGFNHSPGIPGAAESTIPPASQIQGELDTGSTAIGQGQVLASPLQMALVAATIADGGQRPQPTFLYGAPASSASSATRVMSPATARTETALMLDVVRNGTGTSAAIPGVEVAGKTGTAELGGTGCSGGSLPETGSASESSSTASCAAAERNNTDAWFAAFVPARSPRAAAAVMLVHDGYGGETAAPVARQALEAALEASTH
jgi:hypothetical protein